VGKIRRRVLIVVIERRIVQDGKGVEEAPAGDDDIASPLQGQCRLVVVGEDPCLTRGAAAAEVQGANQLEVLVACLVGDVSQWKVASPRLPPLMQNGLEWGEPLLNFVNVPLNLDGEHQQLWEAFCALLD
jgi:hypothetical protein